MPVPKIKHEPKRQQLSTGTAEQRRPQCPLRMADYRRRGSKIEELMLSGRVVPVARVSDVEYAASLTKMLLDCGISIVELDQRSSGLAAVLSAIRQIAPAMTVGIGTLTEPRHMTSLKEAGVSYVAGIPGACGELAHRSGMPFLPVVSSRADAQEMTRIGYSWIRSVVGDWSGDTPGNPAIVGQLAYTQVFSDARDTCRWDVNCGLRASSVACSWIIPARNIRASQWLHIRTNVEAAFALVDRGPCNYNS